MLLFQPGKFFREYYSRKKAPYLMLCLAVFASVSAFTQSFSVLGEMLKGKLPDEGALLNTWPVLWAITAALTVVYAVIFYVLGAWWFNYRVGLSRGTKDKPMSRAIYLYSNFFPSVIALGLNVSATFSRPTPLPFEPNLIEIITHSLITIAVSLYCIRISYSGVTEAMNADPKAASIWFITLPIVIFALAFSPSIMMLLLALG